MSFGLYDAPTTFQKCTTLIFFDLVEQCLDIFMDNLSVYGDCFDDCLTNLGKGLKRCQDKHLTFSKEKRHFFFMVTSGG